VEIKQLRREDARWKMLRIVRAGRPVGVNESMIRRVLSDLDLPFSQDELRRELGYVRDLGLIDIGEADGEWFGKATAQGVNVVEYTAPAPAGIARPSKAVP
jgi:hypothetical protein